MTALDKSNELKKQAIGILLQERSEIDAELKRLGYHELKTPASGKRRGRPPRQPSDSLQLRPEMTQEVSSSLPSSPEPKMPEYPREDREP